jgi:type IV pilus assembly protein PilM
MEVLLVAAKKDRVLSHIELLKDAGLIPVSIDVDTFAVQNAFELNYQYEEGKVYALIDVGLSATNIGIVRDGIPLFNRDVPVGGEKFIEGMQRKLGITSEEARAALEGVPGANPEGLLGAIESVGEDLSIAIERSFSYLRSSGEAESVDKIYLSGGGSRIAGLKSFLAERLSVDIEMSNPLRELQFEEEILGADPVSIAPSLMVAVGLAARQGS